MALSAPIDARHGEPMSDYLLYRLAGWTGLTGAILIVIAAARRAGLLPETELTHALAPPASALLLLTLTALYLCQRAPAGRLGLAGFVLNHLGLSGLFAIEFLTHALRSVNIAPGRPYFLVVAVTFLAGVLLFTAASWRAGVLPRGALILYATGLSAAALRTSVPEPVYLTGLVVGAAGVLWLSLALLRTTGGSPAKIAAANRASVA